MGFAEKVVTLKLTSAIVFEGEIVRAGALLEMVENEAKDLLRRGKAVLAEVVGDDDAEDADGADSADHDAAAQAAADATADAQKQPGTSKRAAATK